MRQSHHAFRVAGKWQQIAAEFGQIEPTPKPKSGAGAEPWRDRIMAASDVVIAASEPLENIKSVPPDCKYVDDKVKAFAKACRETVADYKEGLNLNPRKMREAGEKVDEAARLVDDFQDEVEALLAQYKQDDAVARATKHGLMKRKVK